MKIHVEEKKKKAEDTKEKLKKAEKAKEEAEEKRREDETDEAEKRKKAVKKASEWQRKEALRKNKEEREKKLAARKASMQKENDEFDDMLEKAKEADKEVEECEKDYEKVLRRKMTPPKQKSPKKRAAKMPEKTTSTSAPEVTTTTAANTKTPSTKIHRSQNVSDDGNADLARVRSTQLSIDTAKSWRPSKKFSSGTGTEYKNTMREFERVEALEGLSSRILLQELRHYFGGSAGGIVEAHLKCSDSSQAL